jgi:Rap1a immunity proteins
MRNVHPWGTMASIGVRAAPVMRLTFALLLGVLVWPVAPRYAAAAPPDELLQSCEAVITGAQDAKGDTIEIPSAGLHCWYYLSAVQNMSVLVDQHGQKLLGICAPTKATLFNYVRIFVQYARHHSTEQQSNAAALAITALSKAFPCSSRRMTGTKPRRRFAPSTGSLGYVLAKWPR